MERGGRGDGRASSHSTSTPPAWVDKLAANQLADEQRHAALLRDRLVALGAPDGSPAAEAHEGEAVVDRARDRAVHERVRGGTHRRVARDRGAARGDRRADVRAAPRRARGACAADDPTTAMLREILADEKRHAKSCADGGRPAGARRASAPTLDELREQIATIDRAFGVTISVVFWLRDRARCAIATRLTRLRGFALRRRCAE